MKCISWAWKLPFWWSNVFVRLYHLEFFFVHSNYYYGQAFSGGQLFCIKYREADTTIIVHLEQALFIS